MTDRENVVDLVPREPSIDGDAPLRTRPRRARGCMHPQLELDRDVRRAFCKACGDEVELFDALLTFAQDFERHVAARDRAKGEADRARNLLDEVKRELRNAKARRRRASS